MGSVVHQFTAAGRLVLRMPAAGIALISCEQVGPDRAQFADFALLDHPFDIDVIRLKAHRVIDHQFGAGAVAGRDHPVRLLKVKRHRFLAQDAARAGLGRGNRNRAVQIVQRADADDINIGLRQHLLIAAETLRDRPAFAEEIQLVGVDVGSGHQLRIGHKRIRLGVQPRHPAAANDSYCVTLAVRHLNVPAKAALAKVRIIRIIMIAVGRMGILSLYLPPVEHISERIVLNAQRKVDAGQPAALRFIDRHDHLQRGAALPAARNALPILLDAVDQVCSPR